MKLTVTIYNMLLKILPFKNNIQKCDCLKSQKYFFIQCTGQQNMTDSVAVSKKKRIRHNTLRYNHLFRFLKYNTT